MAGTNFDFTRTIVTSTLVISKVEVKNGELSEVKLPDYTVVGTTAIKDEKAKKIVNKAFPGENVILKEIKVEEQTRGMSFHDFLKNSTEIVRPASQQK